MAYNAVPTVATGDTWSAANHNTYIRDNFAASVPDIFTAAGDIAYATAANAAAPLAIGAPGKVLISSSDGIPSWGDAIIISNRQGGSATNWGDSGSGGTTNYDLTGHQLIQIGAVTINWTTGTPGGVATVTFPVEYSAIPIVFPAFAATGSKTGTAGTVIRMGQITTATAVISIRDAEETNQSAAGGNIAYWLAVGPP